MDALKQQAERLVEGARVGEPMPTFCLAQDSVDRLDGAIDLSALVTEIKSGTDDNNLDVHENVVWVEGCLRASAGIEPTASAEEDASTLLNWLCETLKPPLVFGWKSAFAPDPQDEVPPEDAYHFNLMAVAALRAISSLHRLSPKIFKAQNAELLVCFSIFTDIQDPWTRMESHELATDFLSRYESLHTSEHGSVTLEILQTVVRPAFSKQKQGAITASGRKAVNPSLGNVSISFTPEAEEKPWKFLTPWVTTVFLWCVTMINPSQLNNLWPQITPPTLAMMDDGAVPFKVKGCRALQSILKHADGPTLKRTGLGDVFEEALLPMLALLPTLTEESDSLTLLNEAYPTLQRLASTRFSTPAEREARLKALDKIMRTGVIRGYQYAGDYPMIGVLLAEEMARLMDEMDIDAVKHLKTIIPLMVDNLCNPFATAAPTLLLASAKTIQTIILTCWPRIGHYAGDVLKGITVCWCRLSEESDSDSFEVVKKALQDVLRLLKATLTDDERALRDVETVLKSDERLSELVS